MIDLIKIFIKVVENSNFTKAGKALNMAPSSIARNIDNLENILNVTLFKRSTRQLTLTDEGNYFLEGAINLLEESERLIVSTSHIHDQRLQTIKISVFESFGNLVICPLIPKFLQLHPEAQIEIELENRLVDLHAENINLAIRIGHPMDSSLHARKLMNDGALLCASPQYLAKHGKPQIPEDLAKHNCLLINYDRQISSWFFHRKGKTTKVNVSGNFKSRSGSPLLTAALNDCGILLLSSWMLPDHINDNKLVPCLTDWRASQHEQDNDEIYLLWKKDKFPSPLLRKFIDFLVKEIKK